MIDHRPLHHDSPRAGKTSPRAWHRSYSGSPVFVALLAGFLCVAGGEPRRAAAEPPVERPLESWADQFDVARKWSVIVNQAGSGFVFDERGYVLTNSHVLRLEPTIQFIDGKSSRFWIVADSPQEDLAILKMITDVKVPAARLGRSDRMRVGDPVMAVGNPLNIGLSATFGRVSALHRRARTDYTHIEDGLQFDAAISSGNSGGPLINHAGEVIGINTAADTSSRGISFAITSDRFVRLLPQILDPQRRYCFELGLTVGPTGPAMVTEVAERGAAAAAGVRVDDKLVRLNGEPLRDGVDWYLSLVERRAGETLTLELVRDGRPQRVAVTLGEAPRRPAVRVAGAVGGLKLETYAGTWSQLPDFDKLKPTKTGVADTISAAAAKGQDHVGLRFTGFLKVPTDGVYTFYLASDDGSRLTLGGETLIDNDREHAALELRRRVALKAGLHPIVVTYFEVAYGEHLSLSYEGPGIEKQAVPASALFRSP